MTIRKILLSALALGVFALPALAMEEGNTKDHPKGERGEHGKMMSADTDGDGAISKAEFMAIHEKRFGEMDANKDGKVSKDEMKAFRDTMKSKFEEKRKEWESRKEHGDKPAE